MKIINWQTLFTDHQLYTWRSLQTMIPKQITHVVGTTINVTRTKQGWENSDLSGLDIVFLKEINWWQQGMTIIQANPSAIHVFCGYWAEKRYFPLIMYALYCKAKVIIINESYSVRNVGYLATGSEILNLIKATLRPYLYRVATALLMSMVKGKAPILLAISQTAVLQFQKAGWPKDQIYPFGYFVPPIPIKTNTRPLSSNRVRLIFVGSLLPRKGLDIAIAAVIQCQQQGLPITLDIYGAGDATKYIISKKYNVVYRGKIPFGQAQEIIARYDALILPSRHDGWGVVVNEALLQGVPVITSENVGASCVVEKWEAGAIFPNEDVVELQKLLEQLYVNPMLLKTWSKNAIKVKPMIEPHVAAKYMYDTIMFYFHQVGTKPKLQCCDL